MNDVICSGGTIDIAIGITTRSHQARPQSAQHLRPLLHGKNTVSLKVER